MNEASKAAIFVPIFLLCLLFFITWIYDWMFNPDKRLLFEKVGIIIATIQKYKKDENFRKIYDELDRAFKEKDYPSLKKFLKDWEKDEDFAKKENNIITNVVGIISLLCFFIFFSIFIKKINSPYYIP